MDINCLTKTIVNPTVVHIMNNVNNPEVLETFSSFAEELNNQLKTTLKENLFPVLSPHIHYEEINFSYQVTFTQSWDLVVLERDYYATVAVVHPHTGLITKYEDTTESSGVIKLGETSIYLEEEIVKYLVIYQTLLRFGEVLGYATSNYANISQMRDLLQMFWLALNEFHNRSEDQWWAINHILRTVSDKLKAEQLPQLIQALLND